VISRAKAHDINNVYRTVRHSTNKTLHTILGSPPQHTAKQATDGLPNIVCWVDSPSDLPLIVDTGASTSLTPSKDDFIPETYEQTPVEHVEGISGTLPIIGKGKVRWTILDDDGKPHTLVAETVHAPKATVRLFSPFPFLTTNRKVTKRDFC
jgi:hypothetical protein